MEIKKAPQKDLESRKNIFLQIGLVISLSLVLIAFEWSTTDVRTDFSNLTEDNNIVEEIVPITVHKAKEVTPLKPVAVDILVITDEPDFIEDETFIPSSEEPVPDSYSNFTVSVDEKRDDEVFIIVEDMPQFPGGESALVRYLATAVKYPDIALENNVQGKVYVSFVINKAGEVTNVSIFRGVDQSLDKEALRVVSSMPRWEPGRQRNKPVNVSFTVPINFVLKQQ